MNRLFPDQSAAPAKLTEAEIAAACEGMLSQCRSLTKHFCKMRRIRNEYDDLLSVAMGAVFQCAREFDPEKRNAVGIVPAFFSAATRWIHTALIREADASRRPPVVGCEDFNELAESRGVEEQDAGHDDDLLPPSPYEASLLDVLEGEQRQAVELSLIEELTIPQIAARLGIDFGRVRLHLRNAAILIEHARKSQQGPGLLGLIEEAA